MAGHPYLNQVKDPAVMSALKKAYDDIAELTRRLATLEATALTNTAAIAAGGQRITNVGDATSETDAVNLRTVRKVVNQTTGSF